MNKLWQSYNVTAIGDKAIIEAARKSLKFKYENVKAMYEAGINNLEDARQYFEYYTESGVIRDDDE